MATVNSTGLGYLSQANIESLVTIAMSYRQQEVKSLQTQVSNLGVLRAIYSDVSTKLSALDSVAQQLGGQDPTYSFGTGKSVSVGDVYMLAVTADSTASPGTYSLEVDSLATAHTIRGSSFGQVAEALGLSGTFYLGGKASATASAVTTGSGVAGFGTAAVAAGATQLGSGDYSVEFRQSGGVWQFRVVDATGTAVSVNRADGTTGMTADWQNYSGLAGTTFDTGRGLTISFDSTAPSIHYIGDAGTPKVTYTAQGAAINVTADDSLNSIRDKINSATYADGNQVVASIVDNALVLTAGETGASHTIAGQDSVGTVLQTLNLFNADGSVSNLVQAAGDAKLIVNGSMTVYRSDNSGLNNVISGLTINLKKTGTTTISVTTDTSSAQSKVQELLAKFNDAMTYLRAKTGVTQDTTSTSSSNSNPTYTRGALADDSVFTSLRYSLYSALMGSTADGNLGDIGIGINKDTLQIEVTDSAKLSTALSQNMSGTQNLLKGIGTAVHNLLSSYVGSGGSQGILTLRQNSVDTSIANYNATIQQRNDLIAKDSDQLRQQYYALQQQYLNAVQSLQEWTSFGGTASSSGVNLFG